ncbi:hypothetical protein ACFL3D_06545, partial [Candidatus Omnitrophota bacterium]
FLREQSKSHNVRFHPSSKTVLLDKITDVASEFYRFAEARSRILVKNTLHRINKTDESVVALVAGGYHTDGMVEALKKKGYSYLVVSPRIDNLELTVPYMERMLNVKSAAQLRFESAFNTIVKALLTKKEDNESTLMRLIKGMFEISLSVTDEQKQKRPLTDHLGFGGSLDEIKAIWGKNFEEFGLLENARVIVVDDDIYILPEKYHYVIRLPKDATGDTAGYFTAMSSEQIDEFIQRSEVQPKTFQKVFKELFGMVNPTVDASEITEDTYFDNWAALIDMITRGMLDDAIIGEVLPGNMDALAEANSVPYKKQAQTKTIVFTTQIVQEIGVVYAEDSNEENSLEKGAEIIRSMQDNGDTNEEVNTILRSYYGKDVTITARIKFICSKEDAVALEHVFQENADYIEIGTKDKATGRPGKVMTAEEKIGELAENPDVTIVMHSEESKVASESIVVLSKKNLENYSTKNVNLIDVFKAPNEVINVILQLFEKGEALFEKVAEFLQSAEEARIQAETSKTSA